MGAQGDFVILYGSHTGQAESIAKLIKERAEILGLQPRLHTLDENEKQLPRSPLTLAFGPINYPSFRCEFLIRPSIAIAVDQMAAPAARRPVALPFLEIIRLPIL
ncbi:hypothetical protein ANCDUO_12708 [Ancylostoma duodenale]|uniref:Flavodoxin-like domain-containing protein n=1 Tax=Ancylostoma duodenale TaxID=51022 RepID=A0A0C2GDV7_9BILA|nr:hypothetical protein ANCDUO_12708 [Ancylostoma duodenale]